MKDNSPIFIVGVPRSGTTLLAAMLSGHSRLICGTETDFFHFLNQVDVSELTAKSTWPNDATDFLFKMVQARGKKSVPENYNFEKKEIHKYLSEKSPTVKSILNSITEQYAIKHNKVRWIEKTPRHLLYLHKIRMYLPDSKIIRIVRDPRDTALSIVKAPWGWAPRNVVGAISMWRYLDDCSSTFFDSDSNSFTVKYEDLILSPEKELTAICSFIGEKFETNMLQTNNTYSHVNSIAEDWKKKVAQPIDKSRAEVWLREFSSEEKTISENLVGDRLIRYDYPIFNNKSEYIKAAPIDVFFKSTLALKFLVNNNYRIWKKSQLEKTSGFVVADLSGNDAWLGHRLNPRIINTVKIIFQAAKCKLLRKPIVFIKRSLNNTSKGVLLKVTTTILEYLASKVFVDESPYKAETWIVNLNIHPKLGAIESTGNTKSREKK